MIKTTLLLAALCISSLYAEEENETVVIGQYQISEKIIPPGVSTYKSEEPLAKRTPLACKDCD